VKAGNDDMHVTLTPSDALWVRWIDANRAIIACSRDCHAKSLFDPKYPFAEDLVWFSTGTHACPCERRGTSMINDSNEGSELKCEDILEVLVRKPYMSLREE
jgi:hypothetical protein